jgi:hypothetical protein
MGGCMKVDKQRFMEAVAYLSEINSCDILELDLSEFTDNPFAEERGRWAMVGLSNKDFIVTLINVLNTNEGKWYDS